MVAAMLSAGAARAVRCDVRHTEASALHTAAPAFHAATPARRTATPALRTATPALHTAAPARQLHHRARHIAFATHRPARRHVTPELRAHHPALRPAGSAPAPPAPARESHPRAALPVLVRPAHHPGWGGGSRLACALPRESGTLAVCATTIPCEEEALVPDAGHEANEARGPPRPGPIALNSPAFARSPSFLPRARVPRSAPHPNFPARPALERDRGAFGVSRVRMGPRETRSTGRPSPSLSRRCRLAAPTSVAWRARRRVPQGLSSGGVS